MLISPVHIPGNLSMEKDFIMDDDGDDKDDTKRKSRNLSEKKRRDQFNMLINELSSMVTNSSRKMDKSTVLKSTIAFLRDQNEMSVRSRVHEIQEDWKPSFLSNEEFTHIILESVDGFIAVFSLSGHIIYTSGSVTSLLGHLPSDLINGPTTMFELVCEEDHHILYDVFAACQNNETSRDNQLEFSLRLRRGTLDMSAEPFYDLVHFIGYFRREVDAQESDNAVTSTNVQGSETDSGKVFVGTGRLITPHPISEVTFSCESSKSEFTSRHNLDWKFLALDSRATPIIGYVQLEVVGTSGYDYYHVDDLDKLVSCHEALMEKGEGTSCYYRFLTKGQQWVWLQTRYYISYHQWNSKPEFVVCTHRVISYVDVMIQARKLTRACEESQDGLSDPGPSNSRRSNNTRNQKTTSSQITTSSWSQSSSQHSSILSPHGSSKCGSNEFGRSSLTRFLSPDDSRSPTKFRNDHHGSSSGRHESNENHNSRSHSRIQQHGSDSASISEDSYLSKSTSNTMLQRSIKTRQSSRDSTSRPCPTSPAQASSTYVEPPQYMTPIPLQPIIPAYAVGTIPAPQLIQQAAPITDQVKRKQQELNHLRQLMCQKEEELQQYVMAQSRYNLVPSLINSTVPYTIAGTMVSSSTSQPPQLLTILPPVPAIPTSTEYLTPGSTVDPQQAGMTHMAEADMLPFHFPHQQGQILFHSSQQQPPTTH